MIDNGNHLLVSGNRSALAYLEAIGASETLIGPAHASFPFVDLTTGERWTIRPNRGPLPLWVMLPSRRVPGTRVSDYLAAWRLWRADERQTVADCLRTDAVLWRRFWSPLATAVLNTPARRGSARLLWAALRESFARGAAGCRPLIARASLAASLVDPALRDSCAITGPRSHSGSACAGSAWRIAAPAPSTSGSAGSSWGRPIERSWRCRPAR